VPRLDVHPLDEVFGIRDSQEVEEEQRLIGEAVAEPVQPALDSTAGLEIGSGPSISK
jgi:hypothetical protein